MLMAMATAYGGGLTEQEQACWQAIQDMRSKAGLPAFEFCPELTDASRQWSARLRTERRLYHGASQENCARGNESGVATFRQWMNSPGHRSLLMSRATTAGIGNDGTYWTFRVRSKTKETTKQAVAERETSVLGATSFERRTPARHPRSPVFRLFYKRHCCR